MTDQRTLERGRSAFDRKAWSDAFDQLSSADRRTPLLPPDVERLAIAAYLLGRDTDSAELRVRAHRGFLEREQFDHAARCAFWIAFALWNRGETAQGNGWAARARRLLDEHELECVERGYLMLPDALAAAGRGDSDTAIDTFAEAAAIGERFGDRDLVTLARQGQGRALMRRGELRGGLMLLDEVMVGVTGGEVSPIVAGTIYCSVLSACQEIFDLRRAQEWTAALTNWCAAQPDLVPFRGQCLVHRSVIMQLRGAWRESMDEARRASERLSRPPGQEGADAAFYQQAELYRLRGEFAAAEAAYREAARLGRKPRPGLALLRLAQGQVEAATAAIGRVLDESGDRRTRSQALPACVEIKLAAGDVAGARAAADELAGIAAQLEAPMLRAASGHAHGAVLLAEGNARGALPALRQAWTVWQELDAPYEAARVRVLVALACRALKDEDAAGMELDAARLAFTQLGAVPDLTRVEQLVRTAGPAAAPGGLTGREVEVLRLVATGKTNRVIAAELELSEKTVARHVSNIFSKLRLSSRAAATAYAYRQHLL